MAIPFGGDKVVRVDAQLAAAFAPGDRLIVVGHNGLLLHVPAAEGAAAAAAVDAAGEAFAQFGSVDDGAITRFYHAFADRLADAVAFAPIAAANDADVAEARRKSRSTTRLVLTPAMREAMVAGLRGWADAPSGRGAVLERIEHPGWSVELVKAGLGVIGFVFEGRPNVFADATGVLRSGNTVVFRIGSDALGTARAIVTHALRPALAKAGLPEGSVSLVDSPGRAAGWALFSDARLALAVARGSGDAVDQLGAVARQAGIPASLHGTGGGWLLAGQGADPDRFAAAVLHSLDTKVCNTLNVCCVLASHATTLVPRFLDALAAAAAGRGGAPKLHVLRGGEDLVPREWFDRGLAATIDAEGLGREWEWEEDPEVTLAVFPDMPHALSAVNRHSPKLVATLISDDHDEQEHFFGAVDAPFVGDGFTRWVDGQYAFGRPELGLSNWESGRLFGRPGVLSGDSVFTVRVRARQTDPHLHR